MAIELALFCQSVFQEIWWCIVVLEITVFLEPFCSDERVTSMACPDKRLR
jgi:hypothetical protein